MPCRASRGSIPTAAMQLLRSLNTFKKVTTVENRAPFELLLLLLLVEKPRQLLMLHLTGHHLAPPEE